jgi:formylmethanofuran dehydrogenase subunit C
MKPLVFTLRNIPEAPVDLGPLIPDLLAGMKAAQINRLKLAHGKKSVSVAQLFSVTGMDTANIQIRRGCDKLLYIGKGMTHGNIEVSGDAGDFSGQHMRGGTIRIYGNAGSWVGNSMYGGLMEIHGNVESYLGAGMPGAAHGMSNGLIYVNGNAGDRIGDRMRRGTIIIRGNVGNFCGSRMQAGTIVALNKTGDYPGWNMKRGTIVLAGQPAHMAATFMSCGELKMQFLRLLFKQLSELGNEYAFFKNYSPASHRFAGDLANNGKGEILILLQSPSKGK